MVLCLCIKSYFDVISRLKIFGGIKQIHPAIEGYLRKNTGFETGKFPSPNGSGNFEPPLNQFFFANIPQ